MCGCDVPFKLIIHIFSGKGCAGFAGAPPPPTQDYMSLESDTLASPRESFKKACNAIAPFTVHCDCVVPTGYPALIHICTFRRPLTR